MDIEKQLLQLEDSHYRAFITPLIPNIQPNKILGIRNPELRRLSKSIKDTPQSDAFLCRLPHHYHEENMLHAMLLSEYKDYPALIEKLEAFLPHIDNWAVTDGMFNCKPFKKHRADIVQKAFEWIQSDHPYTVRYAMGLLMTHTLNTDDEYLQKALEYIASYRSDNYYINMMAAWFFATAFAKQWDRSITFIEGNTLPLWVHNKAIQKGIESFRVSEAHKVYLRSLKRK